MEERSLPELGFSCTLLTFPAKAIVINMKQYNGKYGCSSCEDEGVPRSSSHLHRNWPYSNSSTLRTHSGIIAYAKEALCKNDSVSLYVYILIMYTHAGSHDLKFPFFFFFTGEGCQGGKYSLHTWAPWPEHWNGDRCDALCVPWGPLGWWPRHWWSSG